LNAADPRKLGRYVIIGRLGQGGMGTVFLGQGPEGDAVAIKVIKPELAERPEFRARFRREAESARRVRRFTTAAVLDADPDGPWPYLVTEYVEGPTLSKMVSRRGPLRPADLEQLALSVATALSAIHAAGIVHRDLTPANVLLSPVGPKVIDFGLARDFEGSGEFSRTARHAIGTPGYMAPEQIMDSPVTSAADVFAWGAITVFAATGRQPFGEGRIEALLFRILYEPANIEGVPAELAPLVDAALRKNPGERPTAEQLRAALMSGAALPAAQPSTGTDPAPASADGRGGKDGARRRRGHLFGRGRGQQDGDELPAGGAATGLITPPPTPYGLSTSSATAAPAARGAPTPEPAVPPVTRPSTAPGASRAAGPRPPTLPPRPTTAAPSPRAPLPGSPYPSAPPAAAPPASTEPPPTAPAGPPRWPAAGLTAGTEQSLSAVARPPAEQEPQPAAPPPGGSVAAGASDEDEARGGRSRRTLALVLAGLVVLAAVAVGVPLALAHGSGSDGAGTVSVARRAQLSATLAAAADSSRAADPVRAARLSLAAYRTAPTEAAARAVVASFAANSRVDLPGSPATYTGVAVSADGRLAAATDSAGAIRLWSLTAVTPVALTEIDAHAGAAAAAPVFLPGGDLLTGGDVGHAWSLTNPRAPQAVSDVRPTASQPVRLALSADGKLLVTAGSDQILELWDLSDPAHPKWLRLLRNPGIITDVAVSPDGRTLAVAGVDGAVALSDITDPVNPVAGGQAVGHLGQVNTVAFLPGGRRIVTGGKDRTVRLWDVADVASPREVGQPARGQAPVLDVTALGAGTVVSSDADGRIVGWSVNGGAQASPVDAFAFTAGNTGHDLAVGGAGTTLLAAPVDGSPGTPQLISTDPARLAAVACRNSANRIGAAEWKSLVADLAYTDPCSGR
jgi:serine/threonine protein kinase